MIKFNFSKIIKKFKIFSIFVFQLLCSSFRLKRSGMEKSPPREWFGIIQMAEISRLRLRLRSK